MGFNQIMLICIFIPLAGAFLLPFVGKFSPRIRNLSALLFILISFLAASISLPRALIGLPYEIKQALPWGMSLGFAGDSLAVLFAMALSFASVIIIFYSFGYIDCHGNQNEYYLFFTLLIGSMLGLVFSANLIQIYIFSEIAALCGWRLMRFFRQEIGLKKADKSFFLLSAGGFLMLLGFIAVYIQTGSFYLKEITAFNLSDFAITLIILGIFIKSAIMPFHFWLINSEDSPAPVSALTGGIILANIGVYLFVRLFILTFPLSPAWQNLISLLAVFSALISALLALSSYDIKRILIYCAVSQLSFIFAGLCCADPMGQAGALIYILMHGFAQSGLLLCAGIIEDTQNTRDIRQMGGLIRTMPFTAAAFIFCAFSIMGLPPFGGFFSKYMLIIGAASKSGPLVYFGLIISAALTLLYLVKTFTKVFMGEIKLMGKKEGTWEMVFGAAAFGIISLLVGIFIGIPTHIVSGIINFLGR